MAKGEIKLAYRGLMEYIMGLRSYFKSRYPDYFVSGSVYQGYMDMSYFSFIPGSLQNRKLKIAIVFIHDTLSFEVWLAGYNREIQSKFRKFFKESNWSKYRIPSKINGADSILECTLVENPDFSDLESLTKQIENGTLKFIKDVTDFLSENPKSQI